MVAAARFTLGCGLLALLVGLAAGQLPSIPCQSIAPACGKRGNTYTTYDSLCTLQKDKGVQFAYLGQCEDPNGCIGVTCPPDPQPVCGVNGVNYPSRCAANCAKVTVYQNGECPSNFLCALRCPQIITPQCDDFSIYLNPCVANCYGARGYKAGTCGGQ